MGVLTLLKFLVGDREAILRIAGDRNALWVGLVFVLSAGFAREYDGEDLWAEPWHLLLPFGASLLAATLLFLVIHFSINWKWPIVWPSPAAYLSFLGLFWMTAPLAWLYAVPYERFLGPDEAIYVNVVTLVVVAAWRVALMIRVAAVCAGLPLGPAVGAVMLIGAAGVAGAFFLGHGMFGVMAGLRYGEEGPDKRFDNLGALGHVAVISIAGWLVLLQGNKGQAEWHVPHIPAQRPTTPLVLLVAASLLVWVFVLPLTQPEQRLRRAFANAVRAEDYQGAARMLLDNPRGAFPPHWRLVTWSRRWPNHILGMLLAVNEQGGPAWAREEYVRHVIMELEVDRLPEDDLRLLADAMPRFEEGAALLAEARGRERPPDPGRVIDNEESWARYRAMSRYQNLQKILTIIDGKKGN